MRVNCVARRYAREIVRQVDACVGAACVRADRCVSIRADVELHVSRCTSS